MSARLLVVALAVSLLSPAPAWSAKKAKGNATFSHPWMPQRRSDGSSGCPRRRRPGPR